MGANIEFKTNYDVFEGFFHAMSRHFMPPQKTHTMQFKVTFLTFLVGHIQTTVNPPFKNLLVILLKLLYKVYPALLMFFVSEGITSTVLTFGFRSSLI